MRKIQRSNILESGSDAKADRASLILEYSFDYKVDFRNRVIRLSGEINKKKFDLLDSALTHLENESKKAITVKINSEGGDVYQALAIVGRLTESKCQIITKGYGPIMSAATLILACGDKRSISKYSHFMHHEASINIEGRFSHVKNEVVQTEREEKVWSEWMANFTNCSKDFWLVQGTGVDAYYSPEQLLSMGVVDEVF